MVSDIRCRHSLVIVGTTWENHIQSYLRTNKSLTGHVVEKLYELWTPIGTSRPLSYSVYPEVCRRWPSCYNWCGPISSYCGTIGTPRTRNMRSLRNHPSQFRMSSVIFGKARNHRFDQLRLLKKWCIVHLAK